MTCTLVRSSSGVLTSEWATVGLDSEIEYDIVYTEDETRTNISGGIWDWDNSVSLAY